MQAYAQFVVVASILQLIVFVLLIIFADYDTKIHATFTGKSNNSAPEDTLSSIYPYFQDVQGMIFLGFGFLMTFLKKYGYSSVGVNFFIAAFCIEWALVINGFLHMSNGKFSIDGTSLINAEFATATILISFGVVLGKASPLQMLIMGFIEIPAFALNEYIGRYLLKISDTGDSIFVHTFGAYFGMFLSRVIYEKNMGKSKNEGSVYHSDLFSMIGTLVLWIFWPSFNGGGVDGDRRHRAIVNTFCALLGSTILTFIISSLVEKGKMNMVHIANATLAGGVAVGAAADLMLRPWGACLVGMIAGIISTLGYKYITPRLNKIGFHDTCGVNNLHGMPGLFAGIVVAIASALVTEEVYGRNVVKIFEARVTRTASQQAGFQFAGLLVTFCLAGVFGALTGLLLKLRPLAIKHSNSNEKYFNDSLFWEVPEDFPNEYLNPNKDEVEMEAA